MADKRPTLMLIDGSHAVFRAYFAIRNLASPQGMPTGAVFGFTSMLLKLLRERAPDRIAVCFDGPEKTFRHEMDANYKAHREEMPDDLALQWPVVQEIAADLGVPVLTWNGLEADDLIATLACQGHAEGYDVLVVSGDKDLMQLVQDPQEGRGAIRQLDDGKNLVYDEKGVTDKWGVHPRQIRDLLSIMGDSVDNIPGVRGIGEKGASKLLQQWGTLDDLYANIDQVQPPRTQQLLRDGQASALASRQLVELHRTADLPWKPADLQRKDAERPVLAKKFADLGFKKLMSEYLDQPAPQATLVSVEIVRSLDQLPAVVDHIRQSGRLSVWTVTDQPDLDRTGPMRGRLVGVALAWQPQQAAYLPVGHQPELGEAPLPWEAARPILASVLEDPAIAKVGHQLKHDQLVLLRHGVHLRGVTGDAMLASYLHDPERYSHTLRNIAFGLLNETVTPDDELLGKGKAQVGWDGVAVAACGLHLGTRASLILRCEAALRPLLDEAKVRQLYTELELPLSQVLAQMEHTGVRVDPVELAAQSLWLAGEIAKEEAEIHELAGGPFNIGSPSQLGEVLFVKLGLPAKKKTQTGYSTDQTVLEGLSDKHPIADKVLRWRQLSKLKSTYTDMLPTQIDPATGRIHTCFQQAVAATGRLSSIDPNLQNIPIRSQEGKRIRRAFVAPPGHVLMSADYSQIELRVMAHLADDPGLQAAFRAGSDIHRETAAKMFGIFPELVTAEQRSAAKTINFGILYGMGPQRLAREIGVTLKEAKSFIERYFERFPGVQRFVDTTLEQARNTGEVRTLFGRRRPVPGLQSASQMERAAAERVAVNTPVQGTAADLIKRAMLNVDAALQAGGWQSRLLLQVHDELVLEVPAGEIAAVEGLVREAMLAAGTLPDGSAMKVPLQVEIRHGASWAEAH